MMTQFKVCRAIYAGYTRYYLQECDADGYVIAEHNFRHEWNNITLYQR